MDFTTEFENEFENEFEKMPFSECIDKDLFFLEYLEAPKIPSIVVFFNDTQYKSFENLSAQKVSQLTNINAYRNRQHYHINPEKRKLIPDKYLIPDIKQTQTYKRLYELNDIYYSFFQVLKDKISKIDRYEEPKQHAKNIIAVISYFSDEVKIKIIDSIINPSNPLSEYIRMQYINPNYKEDNKNLLRIYKTHLAEYKSTLAIEKQSSKDLETDGLQPEKFTVPQKIKILDKLNIKGMMAEKGYTDFQTVQLLADIFGRTEKSIRNNFDNQNHTDTAEKYIADLKELKAKR